jgi:MFS family permease
MPYMTMLTIFARDVLQVGGNGLGLLTACSSVGALMGALAVGWIGSHSSRGAVMLQALVGFGAALIVFALSPWLWLSILALLVVGFSQQLYLTTNNTIVQETVEEAYRGRILSMLFLNRGMLPLGTMLAGFGSAALGVRPTIAAMATTLVLMAVLAARLTPLLEEIP